MLLVHSLLGGNKDKLEGGWAVEMRGREKGIDLERWKDKIKMYRESGEWREKENGCERKESE